MPTLHTLQTFALVSIGLALVPGPSTIFLMSHGALHGRARALRALAGVEIASAVRVVATAVGLSALVASSAVAFAILRWAGVVYLVYLGVRSLTARPGEDAGGSDPSSTREGCAGSMRRGVLVGLGNAKMAIFFVAFFPQFVHADRGSQAAQIVILGAVFWVIGAAGDLLYAWGSSAIGSWVRARPRLGTAQRRVEAAGYVAMAGWAAADG